MTALKHQIAAGRVGHAYLFTGVRGTGKTTCAKIFAKAVNCLHPQDGDPCGECEICKGLDNGSILDVVEMDAASNNGVDDIRDLRDETAYTPSACQYKVYIIDEVHMLSTAAFNALLKTLEEPPPTLSLSWLLPRSKGPATILSRCQRYDFTRIGPEDIAARVQYIAGQEQLQLTEEGAELIARLADGALRDALSILDTCAGVTTQIDADIVAPHGGRYRPGLSVRAVDALEAQDGAAALALLARLRQQSVDVKRLTEELIAHYRALMLAALPGGKACFPAFRRRKKPAIWSKAPNWGSGRRSGLSALGTALEHMTRAVTSASSWNWRCFPVWSRPQAAQTVVVQQTAAPSAPQRGSAAALCFGTSGALCVGTGGACPGCCCTGLHRRALRRSQPLGNSSGCPSEEMPPLPWDEARLRRRSSRPSWMEGVPAVRHRPYRRRQSSRYSRSIQQTRHWISLAGSLRRDQPLSPVGRGDPEAARDGPHALYLSQGAPRRILTAHGY